MDIYPLRFNNYHNRILRRYKTIAEYVDYMIVSTALYNATVALNDGVYTTIVQNGLPAVPDYVVMAVTGSSDIHSRWYVMDAHLTGPQQYRLTLFRDVLADYLDDIYYSPMFVHKATLSYNDPLLFNSEDMTFNQIRRDTVKLPDRSGVPWIVGYIPGDSFAEETTVSKKSIGGEADLSVAQIDTWAFYKYISTPGGVGSNVPNREYRARVRRAPPGTAQFFPSVENWLFTATQRNRQATLVSRTSRSSGDLPTPPERWESTWVYVPILGANMEGFNPPVITSSIDAAGASYVTAQGDFLYSEASATLAGINGKIIKDTASLRRYRIEVNYFTRSIEYPLGGTALATQIEGAMPEPEGYTVAKYSPGGEWQYSLNATLRSFQIILHEVTEQVQVTIPAAAARAHLTDSPYDMFAIPYGAVPMRFSSGGTPFTTDTAPALTIATAIAETTGKDNVYDVQILPYCPLPEIIGDDGTINAYYANYVPVQIQPTGAPGAATVSACFFCQTSSFTVDIPYNIPIIEDAAERKVTSLTKKYRLASPTFGTFWDFDPQKNDGVERFTAYCTYRPFNPFVRIAPNFGGLYGKGDLQYDARGLILGGDYSVAQTSNAWANYQLNNKNYQASFDRQIQHLELNNNMQRISQMLGIFGGGLGSAGQGAGAARIMGAGGAGMGVAGAAAGLLSVAAGAGDFALQEILRNESIDYAKDQFGFSLGNIQALPTGLARTAAQTINNPLVPVLEIYDCTDEERQALRDKIRYNGMTVGRIGSLAQYANNLGYIKGQLIRASIPDDAHVLNVIGAELNKGVYVYDPITV